MIIGAAHNTMTGWKIQAINASGGANNNYTSTNTAPASVMSKYNFPDIATTATNAAGQNL